MNQIVDRAVTNQSECVVPRPVTGRKRKTFAFSLSIELEERLRSFADRSDRLISKVVERAVTEFLDREESAELVQRLILESERGNVAPRELSQQERERIKSIEAMLLSKDHKAVRQMIEIFLRGPES